MQSLYPDKRKSIAGEFFIIDSRLRHRSRKAFKKIQIWKATRENNLPDQTFRDQINNLVKHTFFHTVTNSFILMSESFYERPLDN